MQAGMGGGSTDCATFLKATNELFELNLSNQDLEEIGKSLGADVVPCLYDTPLLAEGIGEIITPIKTNLSYYLVIVKPNLSCSTKEMYQKIDQMLEKNQKNQTKEVKKSLEQENLKGVAQGLYNVFEEVFEETEKMQKIKELLIKNGALGSLMTGSRFLYIWDF